MSSHSNCAASVVIYAKDSRVLAHFYASVFALRVEQQEQGFVALATENLEIVVVQAPPAIANTIRIASPPQARTATPIKPSLRVADIEALRSVIEQAGGTLNAADAAWSWNRALHLDGCDPEGNVFQLRQRL